MIAELAKRRPSLGLGARAGLRAARAACTALSFFLACLPLVPAPAAAQIETNRAPSFEEQVLAWDRTADAVEALLGLAAPETASLALNRELLERQRAEAEAAAEAAAVGIAPIEAQLQALGPRPEEGAPAEAVEIATRRALIERELSAAKGRQQEAQLAATRAASLIARLAERQRRIFTDELLARGPRLSDASLWLPAGANLAALTTRLGEGAAAAAGRLEPFGRHAPLIVVAIAAIVFVFAVAPRLRRRVDALIDQVEGASGDRVRMRIGFWLVLARAGPPSVIALLLAALIAQADLLSALGVLIVWRIAEAIAIAALAYAAARLYFAPRTPAARVIDLGSSAAALGAVVSATAFAALAAADRLLLDALDAAGASVGLLTIAHSFVAMLAGPVLYALVRRVLASQPAAPPAPAAGSTGAAEDPDRAAEADEERDALAGALTALRILGLIVAAAIPISALLGYFALSRFLLSGAALTLALAAAVGLVYVVLTRLLTGGRAPGAGSRGLAPVLVGAALAAPSLPALAAIWGASAADLLALWKGLIAGVQIGEFRLSLTDLIAAATIGVIGLWLTRFVQGLLRRAILPQTRLDPGVQSSMTTGVGYIGAILTVLLAISAAGLDLSNLAIVAGALSVGIGFGLQAIVNNFVSGVILLVERPVRVGDWIEVGGSSGYVRRINVRSTEIETFDRQSVIVPNSELISNKVINYTHRDLTGRVLCKVGVAYESDPDQVIELLREAARSHPQVLRYPAPIVTFAGFGASSLDFEVRAYIRDVNWMLTVKSDLNRAILKALRQAGVEIPFPQTDLHLRTDLVAALAGRPSTREGDPQP